MEYDGHINVDKNGDKTDTESEDRDLFTCVKEEPEPTDMGIDGVEIVDEEDDEVPDINGIVEVTGKGKAIGGSLVPGVAPDPHTGPKYCVMGVETDTKVYVIKGTDIYECLIMANETIVPEFEGGNEQIGYRIKYVDSEDPEDEGRWVHMGDVFRTLSGAQRRVEEIITKKGKRKGPMKEHDTRSKDAPQKEKPALRFSSLREDRGFASRLSI